MEGYREEGALLRNLCSSWSSGEVADRLVGNTYSEYSLRILTTHRGLACGSVLYYVISECHEV